jgi:hypothetical protein
MCPIVNFGGGPYYSLTSPGGNADWFFAEDGMGLANTVSFSRSRHFVKAGLDPRLNPSSVAGAGLLSTRNSGQAARILQLGLRLSW